MVSDCVCEICKPFLLTIRLPGGHGKDTKHGLPARSNVLATCLDHLDEAAQDHVLDRDDTGVVDDVLKRFEEVFLELESRKLLDLHELHRQLSQRVEGEVDDVGVGMTSNLVEVCAQYLPDVGPLETYTGHVVSTDLDELLQTVGARRLALA